MITFNIRDAAKKKFHVKAAKYLLKNSVESDSPFDPHKENIYIDFDYEGLIAEMLSREGPAMDVGDVNNDGLDDVFIGGATNYGGQIYLQSAEGKMIIQSK